MPPDKSLQATVPTPSRDWAAGWSHNAVVAGASALPACPALAQQLRAGSLSWSLGGADT
jgi:hypothetical protein